MVLRECCAIYKTEIINVVYFWDHLSKLFIAPHHWFSNSQSVLWNSRFILDTSEIQWNLPNSIFMDSERNAIYVFEIFQNGIIAGIELCWPFENIRLKTWLPLSLFKHKNHRIGCRKSGNCERWTGAQVSAEWYWFKRRSEITDIPEKNGRNRSAGVNAAVFLQSAPEFLFKCDTGNHIASKKKLTKSAQAINLDGIFWTI